MQLSAWKKEVTVGFMANSTDTAGFYALVDLRPGLACPAGIGIIGR